ncbi:MAG: hypothetical protein ACKVHC_07040 [Candidatus Poseidoniales archaeon]
MVGSFWNLIRQGRKVELLSLNRPMVVNESLEADLVSNLGVWNLEFGGDLLTRRTRRTGSCFKKTF